MPSQKYQPRKVNCTSQKHPYKPHKRQSNVQLVHDKHRKGTHDDVGTCLELRISVDVEGLENNSSEGKAPDKRKHYPSRYGSQGDQEQRSKGSCYQKVDGSMIYKLKYPFESFIGKTMV